MNKALDTIIIHILTQTQTDPQTETEAKSEHIISNLAVLGQLVFIDSCAAKTRAEYQLYTESCLLHSLSTSTLKL